MNLMAWWLGTGLSILTAVGITVLFGFKDLKDRVSAFFLIWMTLLCGAVFLCAGPLGHLTNVAFLGVNAVLCFGTLLALRIRRPFVPLRIRASAFPSVQWLPTLYGTVLVVLLLGTAYVGYLLPPYAYDELAYHLVSVAAWIHHHRLVDSGFLWADVYPRNAELLYTWLYMSVGTDQWVHLGQWLFGIAGITAVMGTARLLGLSRSFAVMAGVLYFTAPTIILQATTDYTDLAFVSMFLMFFYDYLKYLRTADGRYALLAGVAGGMALGMKSSAVMYLGVCCAVAAAHGVRWGRQHRITLRRSVLDIVLFAIPLIGLGGYWYLRDWIQFGNPVYPFTVSIHGHVVFPGKGSVETLIMAPNTPASLIHLPWWARVWKAWTSIPTFYAYDMRLGGLGLQWTFLELPALVVFTIYLIRKNWVLLLQVVVPLLVIFVLEPADWWARYTLFMAALGAWALAYVVSMVPAPWLRTTLSSGVLAAICMSYGVGIVLFTSGEKRDSGFVGEAVRRALHTAPQHRTIGGVVFPEYRWVDSLTGPTHLMVDANVPALYAFYGKRVENTVDVLYAHTRTDLLSAVVESKPQYLVAAKGGEVDAWAEREPSLFQYVGQYGEYTVYRVTP